MRGAPATARGGKRPVLINRELRLDPVMPRVGPRRRVPVTHSIRKSCIHAVADNPGTYRSSFPQASTSIAVPFTVISCTARYPKITPARAYWNGNRQGPGFVGDQAD